MRLGSRGRSSACFVSTGHSSPERKPGSSARSPGSPRTIVSGSARSWRNGNRALAKRCLDLGDRRAPAPGRPRCAGRSRARSSRSAASSRTEASLAAAERTSSSVLRATVTRIRRTIMSARCGGSPRSWRSSAARSSPISARTGGTARNGSSRRRSREGSPGRLVRAWRRCTGSRRSGDVRVVVCVAEREVPHPAAVGADDVVDAEREHERADRRRGEHGAAPSRPAAVVRLE